jgi:protein PhnA
MVCPTYFHECNPEITAEEVTIIENTNKIFDSNGNELQDGNTVVVTKDLPTKGAPKPMKAETKVKSILLANGDHNIDC